MRNVGSVNEFPRPNNDLPRCEDLLNAVLCEFQFRDSSVLAALRPNRLS